MEKNRVLLVGLGNIGFRYLEGIMKCKCPIGEIVIVEPCKESYDAAIEALKEEISISSSSIRRESSADLSGIFQLAIISTTAEKRSKIINQITQVCKVEHWIVEKIIACSSAQIEDICFDTASSKVWVNTPRRLTSLYQTLKANLNGTRIEFSLQDKKFAIGCNTIHFLDVVAWLSGETIEYVEVINASSWFDAKREGYKEFDARVIAKFSSGSTLSIDNTLKSKEKELKLKTGSDSIIIHEEKGFYKNDTFFECRVEYQSELSTKLVDDILKFGTCNLPTLRESAAQHYSFFKSILACPQLYVNEDGNIPIT